jgi:hypothetical protein
MIAAGGKSTPDAQKLAPFFLEQRRGLGLARDLLEQTTYSEQAWCSFEEVSNFLALVSFFVEQASCILRHFFMHPLLPMRALPSSMHHMSCHQSC